MVRLEGAILPRRECEVTFLFHPTAATEARLDMIDINAISSLPRETNAEYGVSEYDGSQNRTCDNIQCSKRIDYSNTPLVY